MPQTIPMLKYPMTGDNIEIHALSDLHAGSAEFNERAFGDWRRMILEKPNRYIAFAGDAVDNGIRSCVTSPFEAVMTPNAQRKYVAELLMPVKDRILVGIPGNHEKRSMKESDTDPVELIMEHLGIQDRYRQHPAYLLIKFPIPKCHDIIPPTYVVYVMHGKAGGAQGGNALNKAEMLAKALSADLIICGHSHHPGAMPSVRYVFNGRGVMTPRPMKVMIGTSWLDYGGYGADAGMMPVPIAPNYAVLDGREYRMRVIT
jgi:predicted phosphodiesterase